MRPKVSIITINYNSTEDTLELLDTIFFSKAYASLDAEVIIVDNASKEDPGETILDLYPEVNLIKSDKNLGFAGGNNLGISKSTGEYIFIVNNDSILHLDQLEQLIHQYEANPAYGILCPTIKNLDGTIQFAGYTPIHSITGRNKTLTTSKMNQEISPSAYPHGAAMLISRKNLEKVGCMRENYFLYYEEVDWGHRIKKAGFKIGVSNTCKIAHKESGSVNKISELKLYFVTRNRLLFARTHFGKVQKALFMIYFFLIALPKNTITFLVKSEYASIKTFIAAIYWNMFNHTTSTSLGYKFDYLNKR